MRFTKAHFVEKALAKGDANGIIPLESAKAAVKVISDQEEKDFYYRVMPLQHVKGSAYLIDWLWMAIISNS